MSSVDWGKGSVVPNADFMRRIERKDSRSEYFSGSSVLSYYGWWLVLHMQPSVGK